MSCLNKTNEQKGRNRLSSGKQRTDRARRMIASAIEDLALALDQGHSDNLKRYLMSMAKFHKYSVGNVLLIWNQKSEATRVAGFQTWKQLGRCVRRGGERDCHPGANRT